MAGAVLISRAGFEAVMELGPRHSQGRKPNHVLHGVLSLLTCGLWLWVWLVVAIVDPSRRASGAMPKRYTVMVDEWGRTWSVAQGETEWQPLG